MPPNTRRFSDPSIESVIHGWKTSPSTHPLIGDWRRVGYRRGKKPSQKVGTITRGSNIGIVPGPNDSSTAIQQALDDLGKRGGGILELESGTYRLERPLLFTKSNVVLRGAGKNETILHFPNPLAKVFGKAPLNDSTCWSWTGGQVFFISPERLGMLAANGWSSTPPASEGWLGGKTLANLSPAPRGARVLEMPSTRFLSEGEMVLLEIPDDASHTIFKEAAGNVEGADEYDWDRRASTIAGPNRYSDFEAFRWPVVISKILSDRTVLIEQPLRLSIIGKARLRKLGNAVSDSGVESLTIDNSLLPQTTHNINPGSNGICFQAVHDCWAQDIHVTNADVAFAMTSAKSCYLAGISAGGRSLHHFVVCRVQSHDNLIEDFELEEFSVPAAQGSYLHGLNVEGLSSGNVYRRGFMHTGTFDSHRQLPFENLRTAIKIANKDAVPGGALNGGPYFGARTVNWGIEVSGGNNLCMDITDIAPKSLTAGITGLSKPGSILPSGGMDFTGDLESETIAFGVPLDADKDLLEVQRDVAPVN